MTEGAEAPRAALERLRRWGGDALVQSMAALFGEAVSERVAQLRAGVARDDRVALAQAAHSLKTSCAQMGAESAARWCRDIEESAATADAATLAGLVSRAGDECNAHLAWLDTELAARR